MPLGAIAAAGIVLGFLIWRSRPTPPPAAPGRVVATVPTRPSPVQAPDAIRKEMPYPLPPFNRRVWRSQRPDRGKVYRFDQETGWWCEYGEDGRLMCRFRQTRLTDDGIDLEDPLRQMWLTLTATTCNTRSSPTYPHDTVMARGDWNDHSASPYPPQFDAPVTIASARDTLASYLLQLSRCTGMTISVNKDALQGQGITANQTFPFDAEEQPARDVLTAMLRNADPEDRLRAVLRATDDGRIAIDITTKQALEKPDQPAPVNEAGL